MDTVHRDILSNKLLGKVLCCRLRLAKHHSPTIWMGTKHLHQGIGLFIVVAKEVLVRNILIHHIPSAKVVDENNTEVWKKDVVLKDFEKIRSQTTYYQGYDIKLSEVLTPIDIYVMYMMGLEMLMNE
jgi:hypothetical protein